MFELINEIESYPQFVPWCTGAQVLARDDREIVARLEVKRGLLRTSFTTRNTLEPDKSVSMSLVEGPFRSLQGLWTLSAIQGPGNSVLGCRVTLAMSFEFASALSATLLDPLFERTLVQLVDAFVRRARSLRQQADKD